MSKATGIVETSIGNVNFTMTEAAHVYLNTVGRNNESVMLRGIPYHVSCHLYLVDGLWKTNNYHDVYLSRRDGVGKDASQPARRTVETVLTAAWTKHLDDHPELSLAAEKAHVTELIEHLTSERDGLQGQLNDKNADLTAARKQLLELRKQ